MTDAVLVDVVRSGFVESVHHGVAVALDAAGAVVAQVGDPSHPVFPRSSNKPLQAVGMLRHGLVLDGHLLALAAASHSGERYHREGVERLLAGAGLRADALGNTPDLPIDEAERIAWYASGREPCAAAQNCSGKHAAMLVTCTENGWPLAGYLAPDHPLQRALRSTVEDLAGEPVAAVGVDGCGAPVFAISVLGLARAFARIAVGRPGTPEGRLAEAVRRHPEWVGGTGRDVTRLIRAVPGLVAKDGAEAVLAAALPDGRALAVKVADGGERAVLPVVVELLRRLGVTGPGVDAEALDALATVVVPGGGAPVGEVRVAF